MFSCIRAQAEKRFRNALSDLILVIQFDRLVFGNKKQDFVLSRLRQSARAGQVVLHGIRSRAIFYLKIFSWRPQRPGIKHEQEATSSLHSSHRNARDLLTFPIYFDISFDFEIKGKKTEKTLLLQEERKRKTKFDMRPPKIEPEPTYSESDVLTTLPSMHMALTRDQAQNAWDWGWHI